MNENFDTNDIHNVRSAICELIEGLGSDAYTLHLDHWHNSVNPEAGIATIKAQNSANFEIMLIVVRENDEFSIVSNLPESRFDEITVDGNGRWLDKLRDALMHHKNYSEENYRVDIANLPSIDVDNEPDDIENLNSINADEPELSL